MEGLETEIKPYPSLCMMMKQI